MGTYRPDKPTRNYTSEYKVSAVRMTFKPGVLIKDIAQSLDIHPYMLSRWRKEYFEGKLVADERKVTKKLISVPKKKELTDSERIKKLETENMALKEEIDFLKKWEAYNSELRRKSSHSKSDTANALGHVYSANASVFRRAAFMPGAHASPVSASLMTKSYCSAFTLFLKKARNATEALVSSLPCVN